MESIADSVSVYRPAYKCAGTQKLTKFHRAVLEVYHRTSRSSNALEKKN